MKKRYLLVLLLSSSIGVGLLGNVLMNQQYANFAIDIVYAEGDQELEEPPITTVEPPITTVEPPITTVEPPITTVEPPITTVEPPLTTVEPPTTTEETSEDTTETSEEPEETTEEPEETTEEPEETTEELEETTEEENEEVPSYIVPLPSISQSLNTNRPSDIQRVPIRPTAPQINTDETDSEEEEEIDLLEGHYIIFNWNIFTSKEEAQELIDLIEEDEDAQNQLEYELEEISEDFYLVRISYAENADPQGKWILFYVATMFDTLEEAQEYMEYNLNIYPDIFFAGEVIEVEDFYNVIYGIRVKADTQAVTYDEENLEIDYLENRQEFTYTVKLDEETSEFIDPIPEAVEEAFPGEFTFTQEQISDTEIEVTMMPVETDEDAEIEEETTADDAVE